MDWMNKVTGILQQYSGDGASPASTDVTAHYDSVAQSVPKDVLAQGLSAAFRSDQTPAFGQMVSNLFQQSSPEQKSGMLNQLLAAAGPSVLAKVFGGNLPAGLGGGSTQVTPETASQISPQAVETIATEAHKQNPSIVDSISGFYAQHPTLVKTLGATALAIAMSKMSQRAA
ncbi:MAG: hypothetical protein JOY93_12350 [Acidobacteriales bacterium]|nr:hypothetical protein [Terriglobales bacterium]